jgi:putative cardiolipin synthase
VIGCEEAQCAAHGSPKPGRIGVRATRLGGLADTPRLMRAITDQASTPLSQAHALRCSARLRLALGGACLVLLAGCATPPFEPDDRAPAHAYDQPERSQLDRQLAPPPGAPPRDSNLRLLVSGQEAFAARAALAELAEHTLDLQYHLIAHDDAATLLLQRLLRAAQRGVRVRILVDDIDAALPESDLAALSLHPQVEVRLFNPFRSRGEMSRLLELLGNPKRLNRRMHNKLWIADNAAAVIGGRNLGAAYFDTSPDEGFADLDLLVAGPVVREASASFDSFWNSSWAVPLDEVVPAPADPAQVLRDLDARAVAYLAGAYGRALRDTEFGRRLRYGPLPMTAAPARILADPPTADDDAGDEPAVASPETVANSRTIFRALREAVVAAHSELIIVTPYLVPSDRSLEVLCALTRRGVAVLVLTNSLASTDVPAVHAAYARYRPRMLACGVKLFELRPASAAEAAPRRRLSSGGSLHAKAIVIDRHWVLMGSMNMDPRSRRLNTEVALQTDSATIGARLGELFDEATTPDQVWQALLAQPGDAQSAVVWEGLVDAQRITDTGEPGASAWRQWSSTLLGWLIDEELL